VAEAEPLYRFQRRLFEDVLENGGSLLTPGKVVWTRQNFDELQQLFVEQPDVTPGRSFLDKLHLQLADARQTAKQLMAELLVEHFLIIWAGAMSAASKLRTIDTVLSWMTDPPPVPDDVREVLALGLVHPGQWALTRRDVQLTWLIQFGRLWLDQPPSERARLLNDPWAFRDFTDPMTELATENQRLAVLHLTFPTTFEAIVAPEHKQEIVSRFSAVPGRETDVDRRLLELRAALQADGEHLDWYSDPLRFRWSKTRSKWNPLLSWARKVFQTPELQEGERPYKLALAQRLATVRDALLSGSPDWGMQLRQAMTDKVNNVTRWQDHLSLCDWVDNHQAEAREAFTTLWDGDRAALESLAAFLERMPPEAIGAAVGVRVNIGTFLLMARDAAILPPVKITPLRDAWKLAGWGPDKGMTPVQVYERALALFEELVRSSPSGPTPLADPLDAQGALWVITSLGEKPQSWSDEEWDELRRYRGEEIPAPGIESVPEPPGSGPVEEPIDAVVDHLAEAAADLLVDREFLDEMVLLLEDKKQIVLYGPPGTGKTYLARRLARALAAGQVGRVRLVQFHPAMSYEDFIEGLRPRVLPNGQVTYTVTPGPLMLAAEAARAEPTARHVLVIDEINRANLAKVLGELLFLLEYRDEAAQLMYRPTEAFTLPENLLIIATMNTADRSVALVDAAMRRRFHFVPFFPHDGVIHGLLDRWLRAKGGRISIARFLDAVNVELREHVGEHLLIGPSHFMKTDLSDPALRRIWTYNVFPLIEEQLWGQRAEVERWRWEAVRTRFAAELATADTAVAEDE
jgi:energy-coupling factor transporter ATP-binding protein EcfA2